MLFLIFLILTIFAMTFGYKGHFVPCALCTALAVTVGYFDINSVSDAEKITPSEQSQKCREQGGVLTLAYEAGTYVCVRSSAVIDLKDSEVTQ